MMNNMSKDRKKRRYCGIAGLISINLFCFGFVPKILSEENKEKYSEEFGNYQINKETFLGGKIVEKETINSNENVENQLYILEYDKNQDFTTDDISSKVISENRYYLKDADKETLEEVIELIKKGMEIPNDKIDKVTKNLSIDEFNNINYDNVRVVYVSSEYNNPFDIDNMSTTGLETLIMFINGILIFVAFAPDKLWNKINQPIGELGKKNKIKTK